MTIKRKISIPFVCKLLLLLICSCSISAIFIRIDLYVSEDPPNLQHGSIHSFSYKNQDVFYYIPTVFDKTTTRIFFVIHGASRTYESYFNRWMDENIAEEENVVLIAPHFDYNVFSHYQMLNIFGIRSDLRLIQLFNDFSTWLDLESEKFLIFGFSGGGQFVHRFVMTHPEYIDRAVAGASGYYTFPNNTLYPYGIRTTFIHPRDLIFKLQDALEVPLGVVVGDQDIERTSNFLQTRDADLQGTTRLERAINWYNAMVEFASLRGWTCNYQFKIVPGVGHWSSGVVPDARNFLFEGGF